MKIDRNKKWNPVFIVDTQILRKPNKHLQVVEKYTELLPGL